MKSRLQELARRKESLIARAAAERGELAQIYRRLEGTARFAGFALRLVDLLRTHPLLVAGMSALLAGGRLKKLPLWLLIAGKMFSLRPGKPKGAS